MTSHLPILERAISDVGIWTWWAANLPDVFQVEFSGTLLWNPPIEDGGPPSGTIALRLGFPSNVCFLSAGEGLPADWHDRLHRDELDPFTINYDRFTLTSAKELQAIVKESPDALALVGSRDDLIEEAQTPGIALLAFWAGPVGLAATATQMTLLNHHGEISPEEVQSKSAKWWDYWRDYWDRKDTDSPAPTDYACEVTIPVGE